MALADSVPGVSGGTVAFLLGFYDKFIMSLDHLMSGTKEERIEAIKFLIRIGIGWVVGMGAAVSVLASIFDDRIYEISSLFLGLIIFAIPTTLNLVSFSIDAFIKSTNAKLSSAIMIFRISFILSSLSCCRIINKSCKKLCFKIFINLILSIIQ